MVTTYRNAHPQEGAEVQLDVIRKGLKILEAEVVIAGFELDTPVARQFVVSADQSLEQMGLVS